MPIKSMTGFGQAEMHTASGTFRVELRAVNNRFLDLQIRQPKSLSNLEQKIKTTISETIPRGSVSVFISCDRENGDAKLTWDKASVENYLRIFREIKRKYKLAGDATLSDLLHFSDFIKAESVQADEKTIWKHFSPVLSKAIENFQRSRADEGEHLIRDLKKTLDAVSRLLKDVEARAPHRIEEYSKELSKRIQKLLAGPADEARLAQEVALMADKMDISEECTRLRAHINAFVKDFASSEPVGKRMNFLLQEMNREANTIGSKANDTEISHLSVTLKENIEKIREQIQNIE
ncbi:MAG TPA: YicC/YloC family endoribonuclease [Chitinivibrionales bacterium]|nr:YicC/YloC family endoribonuclease [Chitinivibrionales bacterium]